MTNSDGNPGCGAQPTVTDLICYGVSVMRNTQGNFRLVHCRCNRGIQVKQSHMVEVQCYDAASNSESYLRPGEAFCLILTNLIAII